VTEVKSRNMDYLKAAGNAFKKIGAILRDETLTGFRLSIKAYPADGSDPVELSVGGERSESGHWDVHVPKQSDSSPAESPETLRLKFAQIERSVRDYLVENCLDNDWNSAGAEERIKAGVLSARSVDDYLCRSDLPIRAVAQYGYEAHFAAPVSATACAIAGAAALKDNDLSYASYCVDLGLYWCRDDVLICDPASRFKPRAGTGGDGTARRYEPVKHKVAELLGTLVPDDGWENLEQAIVGVFMELNGKHTKFVEDCGLTTDNLPRTITGWMRKDPTRFPCRLRPKV
jgi:hypothetical protein